MGISKYKMWRRGAKALLAGAMTTAAADTRAADTAFGQYLAGECVTCHRMDGDNKGIPAIIGWPADQFVAVLQSYKLKDRPNQVMQTIANRLSDPEVEALAAYFATVKP